jgi:hypothetical protein
LKTVGLIGGWKYSVSIEMGSLITVEAVLLSTECQKEILGLILWKGIACLGLNSIVIGIV